jgi:hypothetical protein
MELPQVPGTASPESDLGLLQRGRGSGWLRAADRPDGQALLLKCLGSDPRWDHQAESRSDYYARLALRLDLPIATLLPVAIAEEPDEAWIARGTLEAMARRGAVEASDALAQLPDDEAGHPSRPLARPRSQVATDAVVDVVLAGIQPPFPSALVYRFEHTQQPHEVEALRAAAAACPNPWGKRFALRVLGLRGDTTPLGVAETILASDEVGAGRAAAWHYVSSLPPEISLPLARQWLVKDDGRSGAAAGVLADHAESSDTSAVRRALSRAVDYYTICDLVTALGRLPEGGPYPELATVYLGSAYSYARMRAVRAMAATDPSFAETWAEECLWDCEDVSREVGARYVPLTARTVKRLRELASDVHEDTAVREAAAARLA